MSNYVDLVFETGRCVLAGVCVEDVFIEEPFVRRPWLVSLSRALDRIV